MTYKNELTKDTFSTQEEYVQSLANAYREMAVEKYNCEVKESIILEALKELADPEKVTGTVTLKGIEDEFKMVLRQNVRYHKNPQGGPILEELLDKYGELLAPMIRREYKESGNKVFKFLDRDDLDEKERALAQEIDEYRIVTQGKPSVQLKAKNGD